MQTLAFDGRTGASGDMILGALVAAGADTDVLDPVEAALGVEYRFEQTAKNGILGIDADVLVGGEVATADGSEPDHSHDHGDDSDDDDHEHNHGDGDQDHEDPDPDHEGGTQDHDHDPNHGDHDPNHGDHDRNRGHGSDGEDHEHGDPARAEGRGPRRTYPECRDLVGDMDLHEGVEADATAIFRILGEAESRVHGTDLEETHFHEVGADDAIADVVGAALLVDDLGVDRVLTTPVAAGGGEVSTSHGVYPVPTPAVTYVAEGASWDLVGGPVETELLTPTGAAILAHFAEGVDSLPPMTVRASGYGAGRKCFAERPNVLRATVGPSTGGLRREEIRVLETNLDDASPEVLGGLQDRLADAGARDVTIVPTTTKKSRPGHLVKVIVEPGDVQTVARRLAEETGTLGIRETAANHRWIADRSFETVEIEVDGETVAVTVKVASDDDGDVYDVSAEYDDAAAVARSTDLPVREIQRRAESTYRET